MLGPHIPTWQALRDALDTLVEQAGGATLAAVVDETPVLVCWSTPAPPLLDRWADVARLSDAVYAREVARLSLPLRRGGHLRTIRQRAGTSEAPRTKKHLTALPGTALWQSYIAESFASCYVLVVWFEDTPEIAIHHPLILTALPNIAGLIASLPPPNEPTTTAGARRARFSS